MAKWSANKSNWTPTLVNDASAFSDNGYVALQGGSASQALQVSEIQIGGLATAALAAPPNAFSVSTTKPQRSSTLQILQEVFNAFGGVLRWTALETDHQIGILGNTASLGELSISAANTGTAGAVGSHIIYEPL